MSRVSLVDASNAPDSVKPFYAKGNPGPIPQSLANVPDLMQVALPLVGRVLGPSPIADARTKEIVILRTSAMLKCRYCTQTHAAISLDCGLSEQEVKALCQDDRWRSVFTNPREQALLEWTEAVAAGPKPVGDATLARFKQHFNQTELIELTLLVATTLLLNRYATALDLPASEAHLLRVSKIGLA